MSQPTDNNDNDPTDDKRLSSLYDRASTEQPSKTVDDAILAKAQHAVKQSSGSSSYFPGWTQSLSIAAVLVLSVTVVSMIDRESPEILEGSVPAVSAPAVIEQEAILEQKVMVQERETAGKPQEQKLAKSTGRLEEKRQIKKDTVETELASSPEPLSKQLAAANKAIPTKEKARKKLEAPAMEVDAEIAGFSRSAQSPRAMAIMADSADEDVIEGLSCQQLAEKECIASAACTLKKDKGSTNYQCLPAKDHCEFMFRQSEGTKEICEAKQGCEFTPSQCYCPPDVLCERGGGEPSQCRSVNQTK